MIWGGNCGNGDIVGGFNMDRGTELTIINACINVQNCDMGQKSVPGTVDEIVTVEPFKECSEGVSLMRPKYVCHQ